MCVYVCVSTHPLDRRSVNPTEPVGGLGGLGDGEVVKKKGGLQYEKFP